MRLSFLLNLSSLINQMNFVFSEEQAKLAARKYARIIQKLKFPVSVQSSITAIILVLVPIGKKLMILHDSFFSRQSFWILRFKTWLVVVMSSFQSDWKVSYSLTDSFQGMRIILDIVLIVGPFKLSSIKSRDFRQSILSKRLLIFPLPKRPPRKNSLDFQKKKPSRNVIINGFLSL